MSGSFTGFSEDDIRKLNHKNPEELAHLPFKDRPKIKANKRPASGNVRANNENAIHNSNEIRTKILNEKIQNSKIEPIPESAKLSKPPEAPSEVSNNPSCDKVVLIANTQKIQTNVLSSTQCTDEFMNIKVVCEESTSENKLEAEISSCVAKNRNENETKKIDLEEFQARQKLIEEQNRKRKELLVKALAVKTKQTQEEAQKLNEVREEFKKLDALLSNDVKILRKQIELASLDYMEAQKRYFKVEKEFLEAKLALHQKLERKEMLTEHLCAIIEKNEERKADKLNELLSKLNLKADVEEISLSEKSRCVNEKDDNNLEPTNNTDTSKSENLVNSE